MFTQNKDSRHISPPLNIPLVKISTHECNLEKDINTNTNKIQIQNDSAHIYDETGKHIITIPHTRVVWLWNQYNRTLHQPYKPNTPHSTI